MISVLCVLLSLMQLVSAGSSQDPGAVVSNDTRAGFIQCLKNIPGIVNINFDSGDTRLEIGHSWPAEKRFDFHDEVMKCMKQYNLYIELSTQRGHSGPACDIDEALKGFEFREMVETDDGLEKRQNAKLNMRFYQGRNCKGTYLGNCNKNFDLDSCVTAHTSVAGSVGYDNDAGHEHQVEVWAHHDCRQYGTDAGQPRHVEPSIETYFKGSNKCNKAYTGSWWVRPDNDTPYPQFDPWGGAANPVVCLSR